MKRKYILAAATLTVLCVGTAAYNMKQNTGLPSDAPDSSSAPSSIASSEPESGSTSVTDNRDIAKAENFVADQVTKEEDTTASTGTETHPEDQVFSEETATGTETHPEDQVYVSQDKVDAAAAEHEEYMIQSYMDYYGATREEAEAWFQKAEAEGKAANEEAQRKRDELAALRQQELEAYEAARDAWYRANYGISSVEFDKLPPAEKADLVLAHPEVDRSTKPENSWDWQYQ